MRNRTTHIVVLLCVACFASHAAADHRALASVRSEYHCQMRDLRSSFTAANAAVHRDFRCTVADLNEATRYAVRLCQPARRIELKRIACARREAAERLRCGLDSARTQFHASRLRLEAWYALARGRARTARVVYAAHPVTRHGTTFQLPRANQTIVVPGSPSNGVYPAPPVEAPYDGTLDANPPVIEGPSFPTPADPELLPPGTSSERRPSRRDTRMVRFNVAELLRSLL